MIKLLHFPRFKREWIKEILFLLYSIWYIVTHDFGGNCNEWVYGPWYGYYNKKGEIKNWALLCFWVVQHCFELPNSIYLCVWLTVGNTLFFLLPCTMKFHVWCCEGDHSLLLLFAMKNWGKKVGFLGLAKKNQRSQSCIK